MIIVSHVRKILRKRWMVGGVLLSLTIIGVGGCASKTATVTPDASTPTSTSSQQSKEQPAKNAFNPAMDAAMSIRRLQANQQMALTSDQKDKIKPLLQVLIDTTNPSQDFLQQKADEIKAVLTDQQTTYLSTNTPKGNPSGKTNDKANENSQNGKAQPNGESGAPNMNRDSAFQPQDIFKQLLASLT